MGSHVRHPSIELAWGRPEQPTRNIGGDAAAKRCGRTSSTQAQQQVKIGLLPDVVVSQRADVLELHPSLDQALLARRNAYLISSLGFDIVNGV